KLPHGTPILYRFAVCAGRDFNTIACVGLFRPVTLIGGVQKSWHDANGNATRHLDGSQDVTLTYDAENRLTAMTGSVTASYVYDGSRVKETIGPVFATNCTNRNEGRSSIREN
ncbi:MAG: hypothetical protein WA029_18960, partial [Anaerolineae bacterium]